MPLQKRVSELPAVPQVAATDLLIVSSNSATKRCSVQQIGAFFQANGVAGPPGPQGPQGLSGTGNWDAISDKPSTFQPSPHGHTIGEVSGLSAALDGKQASGSYAATVHAHTAAQITDFTAAVVAASPPTTNASLLTSGTLDAARLPGSVVLTTDARLSDARQPLTHTHTASQISDFTSAVIAAAPPTVDASLLSQGTLPDARLSANIARTSDVTAAVAAKAPLASPTFTGTVSGITAAMVGLGNVPNVDATSRANHTGTQSPSTISNFSNAAAAAAPVQSVAGRFGAVTLVKGDVGLSDVDNTSDANKPVSTAQAAADAAVASAAAADATSKANAAQAAAVQRANHTGTQAASTITGLATVATSGAYADLSGKPTLFDGAYSSLTGTPSNFAPSAHKSTHATGGSDALSPADIGASAVGHAHSATDITSGTVATERLGIGTASSSTYLRGDQTYASPVTSLNGATGAVTLPAFYEFTRTTKPADATGSNGSYTWSIPSGVRFIMAEMIGGGGGGGSGRRGAAATARGGGGGGASGGRVRTGIYAVSQFESSTLSITIGAGGGGGAAVSANDTNGNNGSAGGATYFSTSLTYFYTGASGGFAGGGGTTSGGTGGLAISAATQPGSEYSWGGSGGAGGSTASPPNGIGGGNSGWVASGGGGGGGVNASNAIGTGGSSGWSNRTEYSNAAQAYTPNSNAGTSGAGGWNSSGAMGSEGQLVGVSGSGGNASITGVAGSGGNAAGYGAAGGGGGASLNGNDSGAGGNGSGGYMRIICW